MLLAILNKTKNQDGIASGKYWWGCWTIRRHSWRSSWVAYNDDIGYGMEFPTLREVRQFLGTK